MKKIARKVLAAIGRTLGLSIHVQRLNHAKSDFVLIDRFIFSPFLNQEKEVLRYIDSINKADAAWSDNFYKQCRYYSLAQIALKAAESFPNHDIAECGVWKGHSAHMVSKIFSEHGFEGIFHIFDSFEGGLSDKVDKDKNLVREMTAEEIAHEKYIFSSNQEKVAAVLKDFPFIKLYPGWIPERFNEVSDRAFSFVHIDVDLYEPTLDSLIFFWERLVTGGFIVVDDYGSSQFPGATLAVDEFLKNHPPAFFYKVPMGACYIIK